MVYARDYIILRGKLYTKKKDGAYHLVQGDERNERTNMGNK